MGSNKVVSYYYDEDTANYCLGGGSVMRPHRVRMTNSLVKEYGLDRKMVIARPTNITEDNLEQFHADEYVSFLKNVTPDNQDQYAKQMRRFNLGPSGEADCPVFDGMLDYCLSYTGGSVDAADMMIQKEADICLNWSGGMHHAKKGEASGFCYVNDIVLAILELLKVYHRVLYVDIDIHHGDGVEEAFYLTDRVMTVSFHKYGDFFPGTGALEDKGYLHGKNYALNAPLKQGMNDEGYKYIYEPVMQQVIERYQPNAIVMCGGADSLAGDRLGCFNLSLEGHSNCMEFLEKFNIPMLVLGGGGYTLRNVARCWTYETGRLNNQYLNNDIPLGPASEHYFYLDSNKLRIQVSNMKNANTNEDLERIKTDLLQQLSQLPPPSGAQMVAAPPLMGYRDKQPVQEEDPDVRGGGQEYEDRRVVQDGYDSDEEKPSKTRAAKQNNFENVKVQQKGTDSSIKANGISQSNKISNNLQNDSAFRTGYDYLNKHPMDQLLVNGTKNIQKIQDQAQMYKRERDILGTSNIISPQSKFQKLQQIANEQQPQPMIRQRQISIQQTKPQPWQAKQIDESDSEVESDSDNIKPIKPYCTLTHKDTVPSQALSSTAGDKLTKHQLKQEYQGEISNRFNQSDDELSQEPSEILQSASEDIQPSTNYQNQQDLQNNKDENRQFLNVEQSNLQPQSQLQSKNSQSMIRGTSSGTNQMLNHVMKKFMHGPKDNQKDQSKSKDKEEPQLKDQNINGSSENIQSKANSSVLQQSNQQK